MFQVVHTSGKFGHPSNWAGYMLMGKDIVLQDRSADLAKSLRAMLQSPQDNLITTFKTLQAMVCHIYISLSLSLSLLTSY